MQNKSSEPDRKKLYDAYEESLFKLVMFDAAEKEGKVFLEEKDQLKYDQEFVPSSELIKKFSKVFDTYFKKHNKQGKKLFFSKKIRKVSVALLAIVIVFFTTMLTVPAFSAGVMNLLVNIQSKCTSFQLDDSNSGSDSNGPIVNWTNSYVPTYIPDGYEVSDIAYSEAIKKLTFKNKEDENLYLIYSQFNASATVGVDTEGASLVKNITINGIDGVLMIKDSLVSVAWSINNIMFFVQTSASAEEAIKIAESVKFIK